MRWEAWQAYADWFEGLPWEWFCTFTMPLGERVGTLLRVHKRWSKVMHRENRRQLRQVVAIEYQRNGTPHLHVLAHGIRPDLVGECKGAMRIWERVGGGYARIWPYCGKGGAAGYCAKYVTKDGELYLVGPWPTLRN
jgi:hypothetical protein